MYDTMRQLGFRDSEEFKRHEPQKFNELVMKPNITDGERFGQSLRDRGYHLVIVPGQFFAKGWTQEHYMSLWRRVIIQFSKRTAFNQDWFWSNGCAEEFLITIQYPKKQIILPDGTTKMQNPFEYAELIRRAIDAIDALGFDPKPLYNIWRQIILTLEILPKHGQISV